MIQQPFFITARRTDCAAVKFSDTTSSRSQPTINNLYRRGVQFDGLQIMPLPSNRVQERDNSTMGCREVRNRDMSNVAALRLGGTILFGAHLHLIPITADAYELRQAVDTSLEYTDNVNLTPDKSSDTIASAFWNFNYSEEGRDLSAKASGRLGYRHYVNGNAEDEVVPEFAASALWHVSPQRFDWSFEAIGRQIKQDTAGPDAPDNRENQYSVLTGPDLSARLNSQTSIGVRARYGYGYFSESSDDDRQLLLAQVALRHRQSSSTTWTPTLGAARIEYTEETDNKDFDIANAYFKYELMPESWYNLSLDMGASFLDQENEPRLSAILFRLEMNRQLLADSMIRLRLLQEFSDDVLSSLRDSVAISATTSQDSLASAPYKDQLGELIYEFGRTHLLGSVGIFGRKKDFDEPLDEWEYGASIALNYKLSAISAASVAASYSRSKFEVMDTRENTYGVVLGYSKALGRSTSVGIEVRHQRCSSTLETQDYEETAVVATLTIGRSAGGTR